MSFDYFWDVRAKCLLIAPHAAADLRVLSVDWLHEGEYQTIGVSAPAALFQAGFDVLAVGLPDISNERAIRLTVNTVPFSASGRAPVVPVRPDIITLDPNLATESAERLLWLVEEEQGEVAIRILDEGKKAPLGTISQIYESPRIGQVIGPAVSASGEGVGGALRVRMFPIVDDPGVVDIEIVAEDDQPLPETDVVFYTMSARNHVLPSLHGAPLDLPTLHNRQAVTLGARQNTLREYVFHVPSEDGLRPKHLAYIDRIAISTSPPCRFTFERTEDQSQPAGRDGAMMLVNGFKDFAHVDEGVALDVFIGAQPQRTRVINRDLVRAFGDVGKQSLRPSDLSMATEITAAVYAETVHLVFESPNGAKAPLLLPEDISQYLAAPSYFGLLAVLPGGELAPTALRKLSAAVSQGNERQCLAVLCESTLRDLVRNEPNVKLWFDVAQSTDAVYLAALTPFYDEVWRILAAGIDPAGVDVGQIASIAVMLDLDGMRDKLRKLAAADVLPANAECRFIRADSDDLESRDEFLGDLLDAGLSLCRSAVSTIRLARPGEPFTEAEFLRLGDVTIPTGPRTGTAQVVRGFHFLYETLAKAFGEEECLGQDHSPRPLLRRLAAYLYQAYRQDFQRLEQAVRQAGVLDPIELEGDNVVAMKAVVGSSETQTTFGGRPVSQDSMSWLANSDSDPPLFARWKADILGQVNKRD